MTITVVLHKPNYQRDFPTENLVCNSTRTLQGSNAQVGFSIKANTQIKKVDQIRIKHNLVIQGEDHMIQEQISLSWSIQQIISWDIIQTSTALVSTNSGRGESLANALNNNVIENNLKNIVTNQTKTNTITGTNQVRQQYHKKNHIQINIDKMFDDHKQIAIHIDAKLVKNNEAKFRVTISTPPPTGDVFRSHQNIKIHGKWSIQCRPF